MSDIEPQYAYYTPDHWSKTGQEAPAEPVRVEPGTLINNFRGETWTYEGVSRKAYGNSSGRITVSAACDDTPCRHADHRNGIERRAFYPSVFDLYLGTADGTEA